MRDEPPRLILLLGADWFGSDARAIAACLRSQGHSLIEVLYEDHWPPHWRSTSLRILRRLGRRVFAADYNRAVLRHSTNPAIDFIFVFKGPMLSRATLEAFTKRGLPAYCLYPDVSFLDHGPEIWDCLPLYDCVFTTKSFHLEDAALRARVRDLRFVSHGFDPEVHHPPRLSEKMRLGYACDVSFVGCWSPKKERLISALIGDGKRLDIRIYGSGWERAVPAVRAMWQGRGAFGDELAIVYAASKINLGLLSEAGGGTRIGDQTTARTWQIPAAGGFLLHEATAELANYFVPGREVAVFSSAEELATVAAHYLHEETERLELAAAGYRRAIASSYTYEAAAREIVDLYGASANRKRD